MSIQLDHTRQEFRRYRDALGYVVRASQVMWTNRGHVSLGDPSADDCATYRFGLIKGSEPMIVCHNEDSGEVWLVSPEQAAQWNAVAVWHFPDLDMFLRRHLDLSASVDTNAPDWCWLREAAE